MSEDIIREALMRFKFLLEGAQAGQGLAARRSIEADLKLVRLAIKKYDKRIAWLHQYRLQARAEASPPQ
jgi:hypothetical protein